MINALYEVRKPFWRKRWDIYFIAKVKATVNHPDVWVASFSSEALAKEWLASRDKVLMPL